MLYDLNVPWTPTLEPTHLQRTISYLSESGYQVLALNHILTSPLPSQITNPIPLATKLPFTLPPTTTLLRRCTLIMQDPTLNHRLSTLASTYDILAIRPTNELAYLSCTNTLTDHSIISLDLTKRYPFHFKPKPLMTAINRGIRIEICYSQATLGDSSSRRNFISNTLAILRATRGRGLVISSEAKDVLGVRAPADVLNLFAVWGLSRDRGVEGLDVNPRAVVVNEGLKRSGFRGVVDIVDGGDKPEPEPVVPKEKKNKRKEAAKRKANDVVMGDGGDGKKEEVEVPLSKRAQKKARIAALKEKSAAEDTSASSTGTPAHMQEGTSESETTSKHKAKPKEIDKVIA